jgi:hypothetical protein
MTNEESKMLIEKMDKLAAEIDKLDKKFNIIYYEERLERARQYMKMLERTYFNTCNGTKPKEK